MFFKIMKLDVLCIGNASYDMFFRLSSFPSENKKYRVDGIDESCGGPAANEAYLLSKWKIRSGFIGLIGDDYYGKKIEEDFKKVKTDISCMEMRKGFYTPLSNIIVNQYNGSRTIINRRIMDYNIKIKISDLKKFDPSIIMFDGNELNISLKCFDVFKNAVTVLDAGSCRKETLLLGAKADYLVCSSDFARNFAKIRMIDNKNKMIKAVRMLSKLNKNIIITLGDKGVVFFESGQIKYLKAVKVTAVDTTGAGDVFHGAFCYGLFNKMKLEDNLKFSQAAASLSVAKEGGRASIPQLKDVIKLHCRIKKENAVFLDCV